MMYRVLFKNLEKLDDGLSGPYVIQECGDDGIWRTCHHYLPDDKTRKSEAEAIKFIESELGLG